MVGKMINETETIRISKFLSLVLRHHPEVVGIELDENGWTDVLNLIACMNKKGVAIDLPALKHVVATNAKKRFAFSEDFHKIRASQGHSVVVDLAYPPQKPPEKLFHGTGQKSVAAILSTGLQKGQRHHVHLSSDVETAIKVGSRHGKPFVFEVLSGKMHQDGYVFYRSENGVWLTDSVPADYLRPMEG